MDHLARQVWYERGCDSRIERAFGMKPFDTPKPTSLISWVVNLQNDDGVYHNGFLCWFGKHRPRGIALTRKDGGQRRFIMVQLPEVCAEDSPAAASGFATIAESGGSGIGVLATSSKEEAGFIDDKLIGFRVLKVDTSNMKDVYYTRMQ